MLFCLTKENKRFFCLTKEKETQEMSKTINFQSANPRQRMTNHKIEMTFLNVFIVLFAQFFCVYQGQIKTLKSREKLLNAKVYKLLASAKPSGDFDFIKIINRD